MEHSVVFEKTLFSEKDEVLSLLHELTTLHDAGAQQEERQDTIVDRLTVILERYQEESHLLDAHLEEMMGIVMGRARAIVYAREEELLAQQSNVLEASKEEGGGGSGGGGGGGGGAEDKSRQALMAFPFQRHKDPELHSLCCVVYQLCRVRGRKVIVRLMPHEVADVEPVLHMIQSQDRADHVTWKTKFVLWLWLTMLCLVPFDICTIDSSLGGGGALPSSPPPPASSSSSSVATNGQRGENGKVRGEEEEGGSRLISTILTLGKLYLSDTGATREAAASCLSSLLTRPDMEGAYLKGFLQWATRVLADTLESLGSGTTEAARQRSGSGVSMTATRLLDDEAAKVFSSQIFLLTGVMGTLVSLFKTGHRDKLLEQIPRIFDLVVKIAAEGSVEGSVVERNTLMRKMLVKLFQRLGMTYLPPRVVGWRYSRGQRSLLTNLSVATSTAGGDSAAATAGSSSAAAGGGAGGGDEAEVDGAAADDDDHDDGDDIDVPEELEDIVEHLMCGLRDRDTVVRWSAAKGIGRITGRLPKAFADDIVASVLELFSDTEGDGAWHGGCLALAELARRGLLLPFRLPAVVPVVCEAMRYDVRKGMNSVGAHVRDAACYVCWAFARAYSPAVLKPFVEPLCTAMLATSLFDREINVRRAAAAAFQENVGRQGHANFRHGIDILTAADYFTLGNRNNAYMSIALFVAKFHEYRRPLLEHLWKSPQGKVYHWDRDIRQLAALSLRNITPLDPQYMADKVLPGLLPHVFSADVVRRHGACLAVAEVTLALAEVPIYWAADTRKAIVNLVPQIEKERLYRGRGGELMRVAVCRLIECIALAGIPLTVAQQVRLLDTIDECIKNPSEEVMNQAAQTLRVYLRAYFPTGATTGPSARLQSRVTDKYVSALNETAKVNPNPAVTRGMACALGALPRKLLAHSEVKRREVLSALVTASSPTAKVGDEGDPETRRNAITALADIVEELQVGFEADDGGGGDGGSGGGGGGGGLDEEDVKMVFDALMAATEDYSMDKRGDVGSWCRIAALKALARVSVLAVRASTGIPQTDRGEISSRAPAALLQMKDINSLVLDKGVYIKVDSVYGKGVVVGSQAGGEVVEVLYRRSAPGYTYFSPTGVGLMKREGLTAIGLTVCRGGGEAGRKKMMEEVLAGGSADGDDEGDGGGDGGVAYEEEEDDDDDDREIMVPALAIRQAVAEAVIDKAARSTDAKSSSSRGNSSGGGGGGGGGSACDQIYFTPEMSARLVCAVVKQLGEKLDAVRACAGEVLADLVTMNAPRIPFIPEREVLKQAVGSHKEESMNWASPSLVFPIVVNILSIPPYMEAALAGLVISVGGLTESVVKHSSACLLQWVKAAKQMGNKRAVAALAMTLCGMFDSNAGNLRVLLPLLKTLDFLLANDAFSTLAKPPTDVTPTPSPQPSPTATAPPTPQAAGGIGRGISMTATTPTSSIYSPSNHTSGSSSMLSPSSSSSGGGGGGGGGGAGGHPFGSELLQRVKKEMQGCRNVPQLVVSSSVLMALLDWCEPVMSDALQLVLMLLGHKFPRVRKHTAEQLYIKLLSQETLVPADRLEDALELLMVTVWDGSMEEAREGRVQLAKLMGVALPESKSRRGSKASGLKVADEMESYDSLVRSAGY